MWAELKDRNGKDIYERDIISTDSGTFLNTGMGIVREYNGRFVCDYGSAALGCNCFDALCDVCMGREVVGNIYDNRDWA